MWRKFTLSLSVVVVLVFLVCVFVVSRMVHHGFSTRDKPSALEASLAVYLRGKAIPAPYKTIKNPVAVTPEVVHEGMAHWADHNACALIRTHSLFWVSLKKLRAELAYRASQDRDRDQLSMAWVMCTKSFAMSRNPYG